VVGGIAITIMFYPLVDGGTSSDGSVQFINAVFGVAGVVTGVLVAMCGVTPLIVGIWALVRPGEVALLVAAGIAAVGVLASLLPLAMAISSELPPILLVVAAVPMLACVAAGCLLVIGARAIQQARATKSA
jgi:hypothetical protein